MTRKRIECIPEQDNKDRILWGLGGLKLLDQIMLDINDLNEVEEQHYGWEKGHAKEAHWRSDPELEWKCWAQEGKVWSQHCGAEVSESDPLGLCQRHRNSLFESNSDDYSYQDAG